MATLGSNTFYVEGGKDLPLTRMKEWLTNIIPETSKVRIVVSVVDKHSKRRGKGASASELLQLVRAKKESGRTTNWIRGIYDFDFENRKYSRNGTALYLTAMEEVFLFRWLILCDGSHKDFGYCLYNMRRRFGKDFLAGVA